MISLPQRLPEGKAHLRPIQRRDGQEVERPSQEIGRPERAAPDGGLLFEPDGPESRQQNVRQRPGRSQPKRPQDICCGVMLRPRVRIQKPIRVTSMVGKVRNIAQ